MKPPAHDIIAPPQLENEQLVLPPAGQCSRQCAPVSQLATQLFPEAQPTSQLAPELQANEVSSTLLDVAMHVEPALQVTLHELALLQSSAQVQPAGQLTAQLSVITRRQDAVDGEIAARQREQRRKHREPTHSSEDITRFISARANRRRLSWPRRSTHSRTALPAIQ